MVSEINVVHTFGSDGLGKANESEAVENMIMAEKVGSRRCLGRQKSGVG